MDFLINHVRPGLESLLITCPCVGPTFLGDFPLGMHGMDVQLPMMCVHMYVIQLKVREPFPCQTVQDKSKSNILEYKNFINSLKAHLKESSKLFEMKNFDGKLTLLLFPSP